MMKLFNNQRGVSLVQLVVAMGITGIFSVVMMRQQTNISKQQRRFKQKSDSMTNLVISILLKQKNLST